MTPRNLLLLGLSSIALQGCIAAAAIPIVAGGGALVRDTVSDDARSGRREQAAVIPPPAATPTPAPTPTPALAATRPTEPVSTAAPAPAPAPSATTEQAQLALGAAEPVIVSTLDDSRAAPAPAATPSPTMTPAPAVAAATPAAEPPASRQTPPQDNAALAAAPAGEPAAGSAVSDAWAAARETAASLAPARPAQVQPEALEPAAPARSEEPETEALAASASAAPSVAEPPAPAVTASAQASGGLGGYDSLRGYALRTLGGGLPLPSAMLADPTSLQPVRRDCQENTPTVVIDLDPQGGVVPIVGPLPVNTDLARILADLRLRDVQIAWITDRGPIDARAVRDRLVASGLDPNSQDSLYVERYPGETKQARRAALAQTQCVIALAGDERADFDDLYNYIREPGDARNLELLLGNGWFLIENPVGG